MHWNSLKLSRASVDQAGALRFCSSCQTRRLLFGSQKKGVFQCVPYSCERKRRCVVYSYVKLGAYLLFRRKGTFSNVCCSRASVEGNALYIRVSGSAPPYSFTGRVRFSMRAILV